LDRSSFVFRLCSQHFASHRPFFPTPISDANV
jgi:hypothetical protein